MSRIIQLRATLACMHHTTPLAGSIAAYDTSDYALLPTAFSEGHRELVLSLSCAPDVPHLVSGSNDGTAIVWDLSAGQSRHAIFYVV